MCVCFYFIVLNSKLSVSAGLCSHSVFRPTGSASVLSSGRVSDTFVLASWLNADLPARRGRDHAPSSGSSGLDGCRNTESSHWCGYMLRHAPIQRDDSNMRSEKHRFLHHFLLPLRPSSNPTWRSTLSWKLKRQMEVINPFLTCSHISLSFYKF